jgi:hypothetical protein
VKTIVWSVELMAKSLERERERESKVSEKAGTPKYLVLVGLRITFSMKDFNRALIGLHTHLIIGL